MTAKSTTMPTHSAGLRARRMPGRAIALTLATLAGPTAALAGCATAPTPAPATEAAPLPGPHAPTPALPPIPEVNGPLDLQVRFPPDSAHLATRGRSFIFGSTGNGRAQLTIDDRPVDVAPNGAFLAYVPVPVADSTYHLRATLGDETRTLDVPVFPPPPPPVAGGATAILDGSSYPSGAWVALTGERVEVGFRGTAGGQAWLLLPDSVRLPLIEEAQSAAASVTEFGVRPGAGAEAAAAPEPASGLAWYRGFFAARRLVSPDRDVPWPALAERPRPAPDDGADARPAVLVLAVRGDTVRRPLRLNLVLQDPARPRVGRALDADTPERNGDQRIVARPGPGSGPYAYTWRNGTELELTGERNGIYRVRLTDDLSAWTPSGAVTLLAPGTPPPTSRVAVVRMDPQPGWIDVHVAMDRRLPYDVTEGHRSLSLRVFGATSRVNFLQYGRIDPYVLRGEWRQPSDRLFRLDLQLSTIPWGYETFWGPGGDLVLRLKRPPVLDPDNPLAGLVVGVDAGHGGADRRTMGPTGLTEADANLGIALALRDALLARGARVVMTRTTDTTLSLVQRTALARAEDVDVWISVHNNAFPEGVNPFENNGTSVYYNHASSALLARDVQRALLAELGLRDLGYGRADLHQPRFTWAPAILTENMFMMIPAQEAALKREDVRRRIAEAHVRGLVDWLRSLPR